MGGVVNGSGVVTRGDVSVVQLHQGQWALRIVGSREFHLHSSNGSFVLPTDGPVEKFYLNVHNNRWYTELACGPTSLGIGGGTTFDSQEAAIAALDALYPLKMEEWPGIARAADASSAGFNPDAGRSVQVEFLTTKDMEALKERQLRAAAELKQSLHALIDAIVPSAAKTPRPWIAHEKVRRGTPCDCVGCRLLRIGHDLDEAAEKASGADNVDPAVVATAFGVVRELVNAALVNGHAPRYWKKRVLESAYRQTIPYLSFRDVRVLGDHIQVALGRFATSTASVLPRLGS